MDFEIIDRPEHKDLAIWGDLAWVTPETREELIKYHGGKDWAIKAIRKKLIERRTKENQKRRRDKEFNNA